MSPPSARERAISFFDRGLPERAEPLLERWLHKHPADLYAWRLLIGQSAGRLYGRHTERMEGLLGPHAARPEASLWRRFVHGEDLLVHREPGEAAEIYQRLIGDGLDHPAVHHGLAQSRLATDRPSEADVAFRAALALAPTYLPAVDDYAGWLLREGCLGRLEEATAPLADAEVAALAPSFVGAEAALRRIRNLREECAAMRECVELSARGEVREAALAIWPALLRFPENHLLLRTLIHLARKGQWLPVCRERIAEILRDRDSLPLFVEGVLLCEEKKYEEALRSLDEALEKGAEAALVHCQRALALEAMERHDEEEEAMARAHARQPWLIWPRAELAYHAAQKGDDARVLELADVEPADREQARRYDVTGASEVALLERMALAVLDRQGRVAEAVARAEADTEAGAHEALRFRRAVAFARGGRPVQVADELAAALDLGSDFVGVAAGEELDLLAGLATELPERSEIALVEALRSAYGEDLPEARRCLEDLRGRFPGDPLIRYHLAQVAWGLDDLETVQEICRDHLEDRRLEGILVGVLRTAGDLATLRELAAVGPGRVEVLRAALDLAENGGLGVEADDFAWQLLARDPGNRVAIMRLAQSVDSDSPAYVEILEHHTRSMPFDFRSRGLLALRYVESGRISESLEIYGDLIGSWLAIDPLSLLGFGLAALAGVKTEDQE